MDGHNGMDIPGMKGEPIVHAAMFDGWMKTENDFDGGLGVDVISVDPQFFSGKAPKGLPHKKKKVDGVEGFTSFVKVRYWHLDLQVGYDDKDVVYGQTIGLMGTTGASSGVHLHWSWKFCDKNGIAYLKDNGYYGGQDPQSTKYGVRYEHSIYAQESAKQLNSKQPPELTDKERKEIAERLGASRRLLLALVELKSRLFTA
jgi:hypothetical protein